MMYLSRKTAYGKQVLAIACQMLACVVAAAAARILEDTRSPGTTSNTLLGWWQVHAAIPIFIHVHLIAQLGIFKLVCSI